MGPPAGQSTETVGYQRLYENMIKLYHLNKRLMREELDKQDQMRQIETDNQQIKPMAQGAEGETTFQHGLEQLQAIRSKNGTRKRQCYEYETHVVRKVSDQTIRLQRLHATVHKEIEKFKDGTIIWNDEGEVKVRPMSTEQAEVLGLIA